MELWQEIDLFYDVEWACPFDAEKYKKLLEKERTFDFLHGLTPDLDEVRGRLLGVKPFLTLRESFDEVRREESRKRVMLTPSKPEMNSMEIQGSALVSKQQNSRRSPRQTERIWCDYCQKPYHTRDTCWDLHGKPADWKPKKQRRPPRSAHLAESSFSTTTGLEEMLKQLLNHTKSSSEAALHPSNPVSTQSHRTLRRRNRFPSHRTLTCFSSPRNRSSDIRRRRMPKNSKPSPGVKAAGAAAVVAAASLSASSSSWS